MLIYLILFLDLSQGYLPGINLKKYLLGDRVDIYAATLTSEQTQLPFDYYYLPYCRGDNSQIEYGNLGQALSGDQIEKTPYNVTMGVDQHCTQLCKKKFKASEIKNFKWMIENDYKALWITDGLPSGLRVSNLYLAKNYDVYLDGFPLGHKYFDSISLYNHHHLVIKYHQESDNTTTIVGFMVQVFSFKHSADNLICEYPAFTNLLAAVKDYGEEFLKPESVDDLIQQQNGHLFYPQPLDETEIIFTYSVTFEKSEVKWASRWDVYLIGAKSQIQWISIINSFAMILFLTFTLGTFFKKAVGKDISTYNENPDLDLQVEIGWKQLKGDVFRSPAYSGLFCIVIGTGTQVLSMALFTLLFAYIGFLVPQHRGAILTTILLLFSMTGIFAGLVSGRLFKMFGGLAWQKNALGTAFVIPGSVFIIFFIINNLIVNEKSTTGGFYSLLELLLMWFGISVPLTLLGSAIGYKHPTLINPSIVSRIPKPLPLKTSRNLYYLIGLCGSLPFFSMLIELTYIMQSIWHHSSFYYLFGFLFLCFLIIVIVSAEISVLMVYVFLCRSDYRWWWTSVLVPGLSGVYFLAYAIYYYFFELSLKDFSATVLYFGYMIILCLMYSLVTGVAGFFSSFIFVRRIYSLIKLE